MNYQKIYQNMITRAQGRTLDDAVIYDRHHIIPKSLGGTDDSSNLVKLTLREHYIAHRLLVKMYKNHTPSYIKMVHALWWMSKTKNMQDATIVTSHAYSYARTEFMNNHPQHDPILKERIRNNRDAGLYNYDYQKLSNSLKEYLATLTPEQLDDRLNNSLRKADQEQRATAISLGKASKYRITELDGTTKEFWSYDDVESITGVKYGTILVRVREFHGVLFDGRTVEVIVKYKNGNHKKPKSKLMLLKPDGSKIIFDAHDDVPSITGYSYDHIKRVIRHKHGLLSNGSSVSYLQKYMRKI